VTLTLETIAAAPALETLGWALVHSLWQGALVAILYACFAASRRATGANVRYAGSCAALGLMLLLPAATAGFLAFRPHGSAPSGGGGAGWAVWADSVRERGRAKGVGVAPPSPAPRAETGEAEAVQASLGGWAGERFAPLAPWLAVGWLLGVCLLALRFAGGWVLVVRLRRSAVPVAAEFEETLARLSRRLGVSRAVRLCQSALVEVPTAVGHLRPLIIIPASALVGLTPRQLEAVIAHELAHIRRYDYLFNLLQTAVETLLFYHPAVWWVSRRARAEREHACDDAAVECVGDVLLYARSLAELEHLRQRRSTATAALALAANGGSLMQRIQRLVKAKGPAPRRRTPLAAVALLAALACVGVACARAALVPAGAEAAAASPSAPAAGQKREVAFTFVAFPGNNIWSRERLHNKTRKLMRSLAANKIKAVGFVTERTLYKEDGSLEDYRVQMLREWLDAGHELGNETFSHKNLYNSTVAEFVADIEQGEKVTSSLLAERGRKPRYFSYPYLNTGSSPEQRAAVEKYLDGRGYQKHAVTIDNMDWLFNRAYMEALRREDEATAARIRSEYLPYMEQIFAFYENYSREVVGREFPQVLMLTAGALNADCIDDLVRMLKGRGYSFVTMEEALKDDAYRLADNYVGRTGDSWLVRWAVSKGMPWTDIEERNLGAYMTQYFEEFNKEKNYKPAKK
jgi:beta-lactamase regulating signal transducer with metallopeptidase domain/peptidoglycan/xylan/chitin deacetylase (PgdA/CDA1 family)